MIDWKSLSAPFPPEQISWRIGATSGDVGLPLAYIDARDVMDRLDTICGPAGWQCRYPTMGHVTICEIGLNIGGINNMPEWIWKADGAGQTDVEAEKGILSDAFKRAAVRWGIGRYLYSIQAPWVQIEKRGKSTVIKESEYKKLEGLLANVGKGIAARPTPPPADPDIADAARRWVSEQKTFLNQAANTEDLKTWNKTNTRQLKKLHDEDEALWEELADVYNTRLDALRAPV